MDLREKIQQNAIALVAEANPNLEWEVDRATEAVLCGRTNAEYRLERLQDILQEKAESLGMLPWEYQLRLAEQSGIDVSAVREEDRRAEADALGLDRLQ